MVRTRRCLKALQCRHRIHLLAKLMDLPEHMQLTCCDRGLLDEDVLHCYDALRSRTLARALAIDTGRSLPEVACPEILSLCS